MLPHLEEQGLYSLGSGLQGEEKLALSAQRLATPVSVFQCPSRREARAYPVWCDTCSTPFGSAVVSRVGRSDYAANAGDHSWPWGWEGPVTLRRGDRMSVRGTWPEEEGAGNGVVNRRSVVALKSIEDGTSKTYLIGEKYVQADAYTTGEDWSDNESMYCGFNNDINRSTHPKWHPRRDANGDSHSGAFGSAHSRTFGMLMCDGSVHQMNFDIDSVVHRNFGVRRD